MQTMSFLNDASIDGARSGNESARKRSRDEQSLPRAIDRRPFTIQTDANDPFAKPQTFAPLCLLSRAQLPLAYLDTAQDGSRLFSAVIELLETCHDYEDEVNVLIVADERAGRMYAVERVQQRRYALCRLGTWVKEHEVMTRATLDVRAEEPPKKRYALPAGGQDRPWWMSASVEVKKEGLGEIGVKESKPKLLMLSAAISAEPSALLNGSQTAVHDGTEPVDGAPSLLEPSSATLEELAKQYMETVYLSRTPLAYFVKGPLARARTAFSMQPMDLISFLRGAIMPSPAMDKKFRDVIADHVKDLPDFDAESAAAKPKPRKKRKWKSTRDKSGLFADEKTYIERWWRKEDDLDGMPGSAESTESLMKRRLQKLRSRETFLQIIVILETRALESSVPAADLTPACEAPDTQAQSAETQPTTEGKKPRKKKEIDVSATLELLIDRLVIWHSLQQYSPAKTGTNGSEGAAEEVNDDLKTFASEVIMPFYGSRIPELANATSEKLGGPTLPIPGRKTFAGRKKPGEPAERQAPGKMPRRPLARVSTETLNRPDNRPPMLHRSATDSLAPLIKREHSETPAALGSITAAEPRGRPAKAGSSRRVDLLQQMTANRREVDLTAMSKVNEQKMRVQAKVQEQLNSVLVTLKKPNRQLANEEVAKRTDEKFAQVVGKGKTGQQARKATGSRVIQATPRVKATPAQKRRTQQPPEEKSTSMVPSSTARLFARFDDHTSSSVTIPQTGHRKRHSNVEDTPSRGFAHFMPKELVRPPGTLLESPTASRLAPIAETPSRPVSRPDFAAPITSTPARGMGFAGRLEASQSKCATSSRSAKEKGNGVRNDSKTLYADLGWESDDYEELD